MTCNALDVHMRLARARCDDEERRRFSAMMRVLEEARNGDAWRDAAGYATRRGEQPYLIQECVNNGWLRIVSPRGHSRDRLELTFRGAKVLGENPVAVAR